MILLNKQAHMDYDTFEKVNKRLSHIASSLSLSKYYSKHVESVGYFSINDVHKYEFNTEINSLSTRFNFKLI